MLVLQRVGEIVGGEHDAVAFLDAGDAGEVALREIDGLDPVFVNTVIVIELVAVERDEAVLHALERRAVRLLLDTVFFIVFLDELLAPTALRLALDARLGRLRQKCETRRRRAREGEPCGREQREKSFLLMLKHMVASCVLCVSISVDRVACMIVAVYHIFFECKEKYYSFFSNA